VSRRDDLAGLLAGLALFADLPGPQLEEVAHTFEEEWFGQGQRILRQGIAGAGFYVIVEGEAAVRIDGEERATLARGDFFGEISLLLGTLPVADVVALTPLRCLALHGDGLEGFLVGHPRVAYRMLQAEARKLQAANLWRS
jgi:putative peptide zinc metalloprotease protein